MPKSLISLRVVFLIGGLSFSSLVSGEPAARVSDEVLDVVEQSVGKVVTRTQGLPQREGSGFLLKNGRFVTAYHVVANPKPEDTRITVQIPGLALMNGWVSNALPERDLALLTLDTSVANRGLAKTQNISVPLEIVGFPLGGVRNRRRFANLDNKNPGPLKQWVPDVVKNLKKLGFPDADKDVLAISSFIAQGDSGSPIVDADGVVVAIGDGGVGSNGWAIPATAIDELERSGPPDPVSISRLINIPGLYFYRSQDPNEGPSHRSRKVAFTAPVLARSASEKLEPSSFLTYLMDAAKTHRFASDAAAVDHADAEAGFSNLVQSRIVYDDDTFKLSALESDLRTKFEKSVLEQSRRPQDLALGLWKQVDRPQLIGSFEEDDIVDDVRLDANDRVLVTTLKSGRTIVREASSGNVLRELGGREIGGFFPPSIAFGSSGKYMATRNARGGDELLDLSTKQTISIPDNGFFIRSNADESMALIQTKNNGAGDTVTLSLFDLQTKQVRPIYKSRSHPFARLQVSPDFRFVAIREYAPVQNPDMKFLQGALGASNEIILIKLSDASIQRTFVAEQFEWAGRPDRFVVQSRKGGELWSTEPFAPLAQFDGRLIAVGKVVLAASRDEEEVSFLDLRVGGKLRALATKDHINEALLSEELGAIVIRTPESCAAYDIMTGHLRISIDAERTAVSDCILSDNRRLMVASTYGDRNEEVVADIKEERVVLRIANGADARGSRGNFRGFLGRDDEFGVMDGTSGLWTIWALSTSEPRTIDVDREWRSYGRGSTPDGQELPPARILHQGPASLGQEAIAIARGRQVFLYGLR